MAFGNFPIKDSYTVIDNIFISKENKIISFDVISYSDSSKSNILFRSKQTYNFHGQLEFVDHVVNSNKDIKKYEQETLCIKDGAIFVKSKYKQKIDDKEEMIDVVRITRTPILVKCKDKIYKLDEINHVYNEIDIANTVDIFTNIAKAEQSLYKSLYEFCKEQKLYKSVEDC